MRVLVAGSHGKIGRRLTALLVHGGHEVVAMIRDPVQAEARWAAPSTAAGVENARARRLHGPWCHDCPGAARKPSAASAATTLL